MKDARDTVGNYAIKDHCTLAVFNRAVDNAEMRTTAGEPETPEQNELAKRIAKAVAGTSSFTKEYTLDKNGKPKPLSELMRMARVASLWPVLSDLQKDPICADHRCTGERPSLYCSQCANWCTDSQEETVCDKCKQGKKIQV